MLNKIRMKKKIHKTNENESQKANVTELSFKKLEFRKMADTWRSL